MGDFLQPYPQPPEHAQEEDEGALGKDSIGDREAAQDLATQKSLLAVGPSSSFYDEVGLEVPSNHAAYSVPVSPQTDASGRQNQESEKIEIVTHEPFDLEKCLEWTQKFVVSHRFGQGCYEDRDPTLTTILFVQSTSGDFIREQGFDQREFMQELQNRWEAMDQVLGCFNLFLVQLPYPAGWCRTAMVRSQ